MTTKTSPKLPQVTLYAVFDGTHRVGVYDSASRAETVAGWTKRGGTGLTIVKLTEALRWQA